MKMARSVVSFLYTLAIYVGLPLLGWGFDDVSGFFSFPQLVGYAISIAAFGLLAGYMIQRPGGMGNTLGKGQENKFIRQRIVRILVSGMLFCALVCVPYADRRDIGVMMENPMLRWVGLISRNPWNGIDFSVGDFARKVVQP